MAATSLSFRPSPSNTPSIGAISVLNPQAVPIHTTILAPSFDPSSPDHQRHISRTISLAQAHFDIRLQQRPTETDLGLLHAQDERFATYGFVTCSGVRFVVLVDMYGRLPPNTDRGEPFMHPETKRAQVLGLRDGDLKPVWDAIQRAYVGLMLNPFYRTPIKGALEADLGKEIHNRKFTAEITRVGEKWFPGISTI